MDSAVVAALFQAITYLFVCALGATVLSRRPAAFFLSSTMIGAVVVLYYNVMRANFAAFPMAVQYGQQGEQSIIPVLRKDCLLSAKGGKRAHNDRREHTIHPCWCSGDCFDSQTNARLPSGDCPTDGSAECRVTSPYTIYLPLRVDAQRDCEVAQPPACTIQNPCTPCEVESALTFGLAPIGREPSSGGMGRMEAPILNRTGIWKRCVTCSPQNTGDCNFIEGVGPYCFESPGSRHAIPCKRCCSEGVRVVGECVGGDTPLRK